jgi:hypothetical protein
MKIDNGNLWIQEAYVNATEGYLYSETDVYETAHDDTGALFRALVGEYGRCIGKVHREYTDGRPEKHVTCGWVFVKRVEYEDTTDTYLRETWVTVFGPEMIEEAQPPRQVHRVLNLR